MSLKYLLCGMAFVACATIARAFNNVPESISASIFLKVPGNDAKRYPLTFQKSQNNNGTYYLENSEKMPLTVSQNIVDSDDGLRISVSITALCFPLQTAVWRVSDGYGTRQDPFTGEERFHQGVDLACAEGTAKI